MIPPAHAPEFLASCGWAGAEIVPLAGDASFRRYFRVVDGAPDAYTFVTIYELEAEDLSEPVREIYNRTRSGEMKIPEHARQGRPPATFLYELTGDYVPG